MNASVNKKYLLSEEDKKANFLRHRAPISFCNRENCVKSIMIELGTKQNIESSLFKLQSSTLQNNNDYNNYECYTGTEHKVDLLKSTKLLTSLFNGQPDEQGRDKTIDNIKNKLIELLHLPENWDSYSARKIPREATDEALNFFVQAKKQFNCLGETLASPSIIPMPSGGIQLEWKSERGELEIEFHGSKKFPLLYSPPDISREEEIENANTLTALSFLMRLFGGGENV